VTVVRLDLDPAVIEAVTDVVSEAFADYPVMRFLLGSGGDYQGRLRTLVGIFVANRRFPGDPFFGISSGPELAGVAICTPPNPAPPSPALDEFRERAWTDLGADVRERYQACTDAWSTVGVAEPNLHLNMLAVRPLYQGRGLARPLLERIHALSREYPESRGVTLTTEDPENVPFYRHFGYRVLGPARIASGLETWGFFRPDGASLER
jgi:GNAT superfamily N-acetyltransferase